MTVIRWGLGLPNEPLTDADIYTIASTAANFPAWITRDTPIRRCTVDHGASVICVWSQDDEGTRRRNTMTDAPPDYTTMTGAQFRRAVGTDADKWAAAFVACGVAERGEAAIADWFADAMIAGAVQDDWDGDLASHTRTDPRAD